jgi:hypothetical protein
MIHPWDPQYITHNEQLAKVKAEWLQEYWTQPDEQSLRASEWEADFRSTTGVWQAGFLEKFKELAEYDPMVPWPEGKERFMEKWGFIPELVF